MQESFTQFKQKWIYFLVIGAVCVSCGNRSDEDIQKDVADQLSNRGSASTLDYAKVQATVKDGNLTLTGNCQGENCVDSLSARLKEIDGVKEVKNDVKKADASTDLTLRTSVQSIISKYQGVEADVAGGVIVLRGTIQRDQVQPLMNELSTVGAKKLDNQLAIQ